MTDEHNQETRESPAITPEEVSFSQEDAASVGDASAAGVGTDAGAPADSPAAAQARAEEDGGPLDRPEVQILGAFVGAFILAKLLQRLFGRG